MSAIEWFAAALGLANVWLIVRRSVWNYPFALVMCSLYLWIFFEAKLYSDSALQLFFIAINLYGLFAWIRNKADVGEISVESLTHQARWLWLAGTAAACLGWGLLMSRMTDASHPYWDGSVAMMSIASQILMAQRKLENWHGWIAVNLLSIPLYWIKGLIPTTALYMILLCMAVIGLREWRQRMQSQ